jgi:aminoglycoside 2'-N-acetyltransferase I
MQRIGELIGERYELGALSTGTPAFYKTLGWELWNGPTFVDGPRGRERTPNDDGNLDGEIMCEWRPGDVW